MIPNFQVWMFSRFINDLPIQLKRNTKSRAFKQQVFKTQKKIVRSSLLLIAIILIFIFIFGDHGLFQLYTLKKEKKEIQKKIELFRKERELLIEEKNRLENDLKYIEKLAREKYRMAKLGEKVFKVIDKDSKTNKEK